jgi:hypothetical protein
MKEVGPFGAQSMADVGRCKGNSRGDGKGQIKRLAVTDTRGQTKFIASLFQLAA